MPYFFYLLRLALLNKSNWNLEKIREVKEMTSILGLSTDWDDFLWEKETHALFTTNQKDEAITLFKTLLKKSKQNIFSSLYITERFIDFLMLKKNYCKFYRNWTS